MSRERGVPAWLRTHQITADALLGLVLVAGEALLWLLGPPEYRADAPMPLAAGWAVLNVVPIALRRIRPWWAVGLICLYSMVPLIGPASFAVQAAPISVVTYTAAASMVLRRAMIAAALTWLPGIVVSAVVGPPTPSTVHIGVAYLLVVNLLYLLVCFFIGRTVQARRAYIAALEDRARTAEQNQTERTSHAVAEERRRIARELHDVIAHHVSVMGVLASGSRRMLRRDPDAAEEALVTIEETGRTALREMRRLLSVLRTDQEPAGELAPPPGLAHLAALADQVREAGLPVTLSVTGEPEQVEEGIALAVYRVVQEALTNALKHAGTATATVRLDFGTSLVTVEVCDTGTGPRAERRMQGHGLLGMRERVGLYGGTLRTGPRPGGGFRVWAKIPVEVPDGRREATDTSAARG